MRVKGFFRQDDHALYVIATILQDTFTLNRRIRFLVDSGASATVIADTDARDLGIDYTRLQKLQDGMTGIGGTVETFVLPSVRLVFVTNEGVHEEALERVYVLRHLVIVSTFSFLVDTPHPSSACSCEPPPPPTIALKQASVVFTGTVLDIALKDFPEWGIPMMYVTFTVQQSWKGADSATITIATAPDGAACGYPFTKGEGYLVYAHPTENTIGGEIGVRVPITGLCDRTKSVSEAHDEMTILSRATAVTQSVWGRLKYLLFRKARSPHQ